MRAPPSLTLVQVIAARTGHPPFWKPLMPSEEGRATCAGESVEIALDLKERLDGGDLRETGGLVRSLAEARIKRSRAVELLAEGCSYEEIARGVGYTNRGSAHRAVSKGLSKRQGENIDHLRALEGDRLDALQAALWDQAMAGDLRAITAVVRVIGCRIRLFGLDQYGKDGDEGFPRALVVGPPGGNPGEATVRD